MIKTLKEFVDKRASDKDICKDYSDYSYEIIKMMENIYRCCYRFDLFPNQTLFLLNNALEPFVKDKEEKELLGL